MRAVRKARKHVIAGRSSAAVNAQVRAQQKKLFLLPPGEGARRADEGMAIPLVAKARRHVIATPLSAATAPSQHCTPFSHLLGLALIRPSGTFSAVHALLPQGEGAA